MDSLVPAMRRGRTELVYRASSAGSVSELFAIGAERLRRLVPHDASAWLMTDPATGLPTAPSRIEGFTASAEFCTDHWRREFIDEDVNRFRDLARAKRPAAALRAMVIDPWQSPRFRRSLQPFGFSDELRAVLRVGDTPWATVTLWRRSPGPAFSTTETDLLADLSAPLGEVIRRRIRDESITDGMAPQERPGLLIFDDRFRLTSVNDSAPGWLEELPLNDRVPTQLGLQLPLPLLVVAARARDSLIGGGDGTARIRVRSRRGRWLMVHASTMRNGDGLPASTAVMIEPASHRLIAPIVVEAYGLTEREQEVIRQIARGEGTEEIARSLYLSPHTVRGHVKSILAKVGVSTRGELIATLFTDFYEPAHIAAGAHRGLV